MAYNFSRTDDYAIIEDGSTSSVILVTRVSSPVFSLDGYIYIPQTPTNFHCIYGDIGTIDGVSPGSMSDAVLRLGKIFKGFAPIKITVE